MSEPDGDRQGGEPAAERRAAQDGAAELERMGIDPRAVGLEPPPVPGPPPAPGPARGVVPLPTRSGPHGQVPVPPSVSSQVADPPPPPPASPPPATGPPSPAAPPARGPATYGRARPAVHSGTGPLGPTGAPSDRAETTLSRPIGGVAPPSGAAADQLRPLAQVVAPPSLGSSAALRRLGRAVTLGLLEPGAAAAVEYERQLVARVRLRRQEPRVIAFVSGKGGVGTTTTAIGVALTLATLRSDTTALVSARSGAGSVAERLVGQPAPPVTAVTGREAQEPLWVHGSLAVVDGAPWHTPASADALGRLLDQLRGQHPLTVVDVGNDLSESARRAIARADQVVLVTSASREGVGAVQVALSRVYEADPFRLHTAVLALTCLNGRQYRRTVRSLRTVLGIQAPRTVPVGFDPWLAAGDRIEPGQLRAATREAYLQVAGLVVEPGAHEQWFAQPGRDPVPGHGQPAASPRAAPATYSPGGGR